MDSLTQIVLGAAVGEVVMGKKAGNKALIWGAIGGTIPDLDVFFTSFFDPVQALFVHRGFSHSIFFPIIAAPLLGWLLAWVYQNSTLNWIDWTKLMFWTIFTHPLLDIFTNYGTGLFYPLWGERIAFNTIYVVDPLYTIPLLIAFIATLFLKRKNQSRRYINLAALGFSCLYLVFTIFNKLDIDQRVNAYIKHNKINSSAFMTVPAPLSNLLWSVIIKVPEGYLVGYLGLFESVEEMKTSFVPRNDHLLDKLTTDEKVIRLKAFSKDYYSIRQQGDHLIFNDLRFSTFRGWFDLNAGYIFAFKLDQNNHGLSIERESSSQQMRKQDVNRLWDRILKP